MSREPVSCDIVIKKRRLLPLQCLSASFKNKDASSNFSLRKMSMKYICCPHKVIPLQKHGDFPLQNIKENQMGRQRRFVWKRSPEPVQRVVVESVGFIDVTLLSEIWRTLKKSHLQGAVDVAVKRGGVAGHEEEDVWLRRAGDGADVTKCLQMTHDIQGPSLMDQTGVQSCSQVTH